MPRNPRPPFPVPPVVLAALILSGCVPAPPKTEAPEPPGSAAGRPEPPGSAAGRPAPTTPGETRTGAAASAGQAGPGSTFSVTEGKFGQTEGRATKGFVPQIDLAGIPWGGTVNLHRPVDPGNLNPVTRRDNDSTQILRLLCPQLAVVHADDIVLHPYMAESMPVLSEDKITYTWRLRKGVKWHDGSGDDVTAHDYKAAWDKLFDETVDAAHQRAVFERYASLEVVDDYTFAVKMTEPYFAGVWQVGYDLFPIRAKVFAAMSGVEFNDHPIRREPMSYGLWQFERWNQGTDLVLRRNDVNSAIFAAANQDLNLKSPRIDRLRWVFVKDLVGAFEMLSAGEIDVMAMGADDWELRTKDAAFIERFHKAEYYLPQWGYIGWNLRLEMFKDVRVRKALTLLMRRQEIVDTIRHGHATVINGPNFIHSRAYDHSYEPVPFDPAAASALLAEVGWKDADGDGWLDKDGRRFAFELLMPSSRSADSDALVLTFQQDAQKAGIEVTVRPLEWAVFQENLKEARFEACYLSWVPDPTYEDPFEIWHSSQAEVAGSANRVGYANPEADRLMEAIRAEFDDEKRYVLLRQAHRLIGQDFGYSWLWCGESLVAVSKRWTNVQIHTLGVRYWEWYLTEGGRTTPEIPASG